MSILRASFGLLLPATAALVAPTNAGGPPQPHTFSVVAVDPEAGEAGVAVASRFFAVGTVVPHARAGVGAVATQSFANTSYGPRGLDLLERGLSPAEAIDVLTRDDADREQRQVGIVGAHGESATSSGESCLDWAGGRHGKNYAVQGNILTGEEVVVAMEKAFLNSEGRPLAERLYGGLKAGDDAGGDSRGKQSASILVVREGAGYGGYTDLAVDIRVDDHVEPLKEIGRLLSLALVNDYWNRAWTAFKEKRMEQALIWQERTAERSEDVPAMHAGVLYDLAVIRLANDDESGAKEALDRATALEPKLKIQAATDDDLAGLR